MYLQILFFFCLVLYVSHTHPLQIYANCKNKEIGEHMEKFGHSTHAYQGQERQSLVLNSTNIEGEAQSVEFQFQPSPLVFSCTQCFITNVVTTHYKNFFFLNQ